MVDTHDTVRIVSAEGASAGEAFLETVRERAQALLVAADDAFEEVGLPDERARPRAVRCRVRVVARRCRPDAYRGVIRRLRRRLRSKEASRFRYPRAMESGGRVMPATAAPTPLEDESVAEIAVNGGGNDPASCPHRTWDMSSTVPDVEFDDARRIINKIAGTGKR